MKTLAIILAAWRGINANVIVGLSTAVAANTASPFMSIKAAVICSIAAAVAASLDKTIAGWIDDLRKSISADVPHKSAEYVLPKLPAITTETKGQS